MSPGVTTNPRASTTCRDRGRFEVRRDRNDRVTLDEHIGDLVASRGGIDHAAAAHEHDGLRHRGDRVHHGDTPWIRALISRCRRSMSTSPGAVIEPFSTTTLP